MLYASEAIAYIKSANSSAAASALATPVPYNNLNLTANALFVAKLACKFATVVAVALPRTAVILSIWLE